jgi:hypothetical protein
MKTELTNVSVRECYVVEIHGIATAEYCVFVKALSASLRLKQEFPNRNVKLRDADAKPALIKLHRFSENNECWAF